MSQPDPAPSTRRIRMLFLILGGLLLVWLPLEDLSENWALLFALALCALIASRVLSTATQAARGRWYTYPLAGILAGLAATPAALFLMAFKSGVHGHGRPDFTPDQVTAVLLRAPVWVISGLLLGSGIGIYRKLK